MRADGFGEVAARSAVDGVGSGVVDVVGGRRAPSFGIAVVGGVRDLRHVGLPWGGRRRSEESREEGRLRRLEAARYEKGPGSGICGPSEVVRTGCRPRVRICVCRPCPLYCQSGHQRSVRRADEESMSNLGFNSGEETWAAHRCAGHVESKVAERKGGPQGVDYGESPKRHRFRTRGRAKVGVRRWGKADGSRRKPTGPSAARRSPVERRLPICMCLRRRPTPAPSERTHEGPRRAGRPAVPTRASPSSSPTTPPWLQRPSSRSRVRAKPRRRRF